MKTIKNTIITLILLTFSFSTFANGEELEENLPYQDFTISEHSPFENDLLIGIIEKAPENEYDAKYTLNGYFLDTDQIKDSDIGKRASIEILWIDPLEKTFFILGVNIDNQLTPEENFQYYFFLNNISDIIKDENKKDVIMNSKYVPLIQKAYTDYKYGLDNQLTYNEKSELLNFVVSNELFITIQ